MEAQLGSAGYQALINEFEKSAPVSIRVNPFKPTTSFEEESVPWCSSGFYLNERPSFTLDPTFHAGAYYVQEASSMFLEQAVLHAIDIRKPIKALDLCAAPGGKSTHLLSLLNKDSLLVSNEVIRSRANILAENILKWGNPNVIVTQNDPQDFSELAGYFDLIVIDAPCSGEGMFRKEPQAIQEWSPANVQLCSQRQRRIVSDVVPALKKDGILIYSTCTYNEKENEENLKWLSHEHDLEFLTIPLKPEWAVQEIHSEKAIGYRFYPHQVKGEGFFISVMRKLRVENGTHFRSGEKSKPIKGLEVLHSWLNNPPELSYQQQSDNIQLFPLHLVNDWQGLSKQLRIVQSGICAGSIKHQKFIPDHGLALSQIINKENIPTYSLTKEEALQYLRKENVSKPELPLGYTLITFSGLGLGWANCLDSRMNNMYPTSWRIRLRGN
jgi:16S rRNA C967 or C1407 C5-methylase (RsmB/RsmF family)/NOL1/NOP2/fmu family ribosome biogenesis protein